MLRLAPQPLALLRRALLAVGGIALAAGCNSQTGSTTSATSSDPGNPTGGTTAAPLAMTTYRNDLSRTGINAAETTLSRSNVNVASFGKIAALPVDGQVYAQPLYVSGVNGRNLVFVATEHDSVYAFDTASLSATPVWQRHFLGDSQTPCNLCRTLDTADITSPNIYPEVGITSTPVIDLDAGVLYVMAATIENGEIGSGGVSYNKLHVLSLATGNEMPGSPVAMSGAYPAPTTAQGRGTDGKIHYQAGEELSRAALTLTNGIVYIAFSSYDDQEPSHGWILAYNAYSPNSPTSLQQAGQYLTSPNYGLVSVWMAGNGPAVDSTGNLFFATANLDNENPDYDDPGDSVLKIAPATAAGGMQNLDFFTPFDRVNLAVNDIDLGSGGIVLLPQQSGSPLPSLMVAGGKEGTLYLLNRDNLGGWNSDPAATSDPQVVDELLRFVPGNVADGPGIYGTPAYWNGTMFLASAGDYLRSIPIADGLFDRTHMTQARARDKIQRRGATPSISANGTADAIVWYVDASALTYNFDAVNNIVNLTSHGPAVLVAYSTDDLSHPLYRSDAAGPVDRAGLAVKFAVPTVVNGLVFVGTQNEVSVYGQRPQAAPSVALANSASGQQLSSPGALASLYGQNLAPSTGSAPSLPLPTALDQTQVFIDGLPAAMLYVSPTQLNVQVPAGASSGTVSVAVVSAAGTLVAAGSAQLAAQDVGIYQTPEGYMNGQIFYDLPTTNPDGTVSYSGTYVNTAKYDAQTRSYSLNPMSLDPALGSAYLIIYATGVDSISVPNVLIGGVPYPTLYSGPQNTYPGLDQLNVYLPPSVARGTLSVQIPGYAQTVQLQLQ